MRRLQRFVDSHLCAKGSRPDELTDGGLRPLPAPAHGPLEERHPCGLSLMGSRQHSATTARLHVSPRSQRTAAVRLIQTAPSRISARWPARTRLPRLAADRGASARASSVTGEISAACETAVTCGRAVATDTLIRDALLCRPNDEPRERAPSFAGSAPTRARFRDHKALGRTPRSMKRRERGCCDTAKRSDRAERGDTSSRREGRERFEKAERCNGTERLITAERSGRPKRPERAERFERAERCDTAGTCVTCDIATFVVILVHRNALQSSQGRGALLCADPAVRA